MFYVHFKILKKSKGQLIREEGVYCFVGVPYSDGGRGSRGVPGPLWNLEYNHSSTHVTWIVLAVKLVNCCVFFLVG